MTYPGELLHPELIREARTYYALTAKQWRLVSVIGKGANTATCREKRIGRRRIITLYDHFRTVRTVELALQSAQRQKLVRLWFLYGNHGKHHSDAGHHFIQHFLERPDVDMQEEFMHYTDKCPQACVVDVCQVLNMTWDGTLLHVKEEERHGTGTTR